MKSKWLALLIAVMTVAALTGCAGTPAASAPASAQATPSPEASAPQESVAPPSQTAAADAVWDPYTPYAETVTFTKGVSKATSENDITYEKNPFVDYVKEKFNIETKVAWEVDPANYDQKVSLSIAAGEIPDIMVVNRKVFKQLLDNGLVADMTEAYDKCISPFLKEQLDVNGEALFKEVTVDGKLMGIPSPSLTHCHNVLWIRKDWLDKLGLQEPKTVDDVLNVAKAFIEQDPGQNGKGATVGLTGPDTVYLGYNTWGGLDTMFNAFGAYPGSWITVDGKVAYGSVQPQMKDALAKLRDAYSQGILDKEFAIRKGEDRDALLAAGKLGMFFSVWWPAGGVVNSITNHPEAEWIALSAPVNAQGKLTTPTNDPLQAILIVRKGYEHPEAIVKALNGSYDVLRGNGDGAAAYADWQKNNAGLSWGYMPIAIEINYPDIVVRGVADIENAIAAGGDTSKLKYQMFAGEVPQIMANRKDPKKDVNNFMLDIARTMGPKAAGDSNVEFVTTAFFGTTPAMETKWSNLKKMETETILQIIMGEKPIEAFDTFVTQWNAAGGQEILDEITAGK